MSWISLHTKTSTQKNKLDIQVLWGTREQHQRHGRDLPFETTTHKSSFASDVSTIWRQIQTVSNFKIQIHCVLAQCVSLAWKFCVDEDNWRQRWLPWTYNKFMVAQIVPVWYLFFSSPLSDAKKMGEYYLVALISLKVTVKAQCTLFVFLQHLLLSCLSRMSKYMMIKHLFFSPLHLHSVVDQGIFQLP